MHNRKRIFTAQRKFILAVLIVISLITVLGFGLMIQYNLGLLRNELDQEGATYVKILSRDFAGLLMNGDAETGASITHILRSQNNILQLTLFDKKQNPVYLYQRDAIFADNNNLRQESFLHYFDDSVSMTVPVSYRETPYGSAEVSISTDLLNQALKTFVVQTGAITLALLAAALFLIYLIQRYFSRPVRMLASSLIRTGESQDHTITLPDGWHGEVGEMFRGFNRMQEQVLQAKAQYKRTEEDLKNALSIANDGTWVWSPLTGEVRYSERYFTMAGYEPDAFAHSFEEFRNRVHPDDFSSVEQSLQQYLGGKSERHDVEFRYLHKNGKYMWIRGRGKIVKRDNEGRPLRIMGTHTDITQRKIAEYALYESEQMYRSLIETTSAIAWQYEIAYDRFTYMGPQIEKLTGYAPDEWTDMEFWAARIHPEDRDYAINYCQSHSQSDDQYTIDYRCITADDKTIWIRDAVSVIREDGQPVVLRGFFIDITELKQSEAALQRSQKLEAIGQLTGGIAHDFNNILGIILGNISLLDKKADLDESLHKHVYAIERSTQRAVELTRKLLDFSRKEAASIAAVNVNAVMQDIHNLLAQSVTPQVSIDYRFEKKPWHTDIDAGDFENALVNLVINARDALGGKGNISIETRNVVIDSEFCRSTPDATPGQFIELAVSDNGCGIPVDIQNKIFDPFFTTKEQGKGTGLGLAMVFGFLKRSCGFIKLYSEAGTGTTIRLYLPRSTQDDISESADDTATPVIETGNEALLVVDDETDLSAMATDFLEEQGYQVYCTDNGRQALELLRQHPEIQLLFSDVVMPEMNGYELAEEALAVKPGIKILLTSGYTDMAVAHNGQARFNVNLLSKPYNLSELSKRIRQSLDQ